MTPVRTSLSGPVKCIHVGGGRAYSLMTSWLKLLERLPFTIQRPNNVLDHEPVLLRALLMTPVPPCMLVTKELVRPFEFHSNPDTFQLTIQPGTVDVHLSSNKAVLKQLLKCTNSQFMNRPTDRVMVDICRGLGCSPRLRSRFKANDL